MSPTLKQRIDYERGEVEKEHKRREEEKKREENKRKKQAAQERSKLAQIEELTKKEHTKDIEQDDMEKRFIMIKKPVPEKLSKDCALESRYNF